MQKPYTSFNTYYFVPFLLWVLLGGVLQLVFTQESLFRAINSSHNSLLDTTMYYGTYLGEGAVITVVLLSLMLVISALRSWWYVIVAILVNVIPSVITQIIKRSINAPRPLNTFSESAWVHTLPEWPKHMSNSFPSGHTCGAFTFFTFLAILLLPKYKYLGVFFFVLAFIVAYSRVYLAVHFFKDVYVGSIIGTVATVCIVALMNKYKGSFLKKA